MNTDIDLIKKGTRIILKNQLDSADNGLRIIGEDIRIDTSKTVVSETTLDAYIESIEIENTKLKTALRNLVKLKKYKDLNGKDKHYTVAKPLAWEAAEKALD